MTGNARQNKYFDELFSANRILAIVRGLDAKASVERASVAWGSGLDLVEVTIETEAQMASLAAVVAEGHARGFRVGAGTVRTVEQVDACRELGADFSVAPGFSPEVLEYCMDVEFPHIPGVATPTEVQSVVSLGCFWVKVFPAFVLGPAWLKAMRAPFPQVRMLATGGISADNLASYLRFGAQAVGVGSGFDSEHDARALAAAVKMVEQI